MNIKLDKDNPIPIGVQVKEQIKMLINSGDYKEGDKLPSINQLSSFLEVNKNTVVTVLKDLENENYVKSYRGKGVFVTLKNKGKEINAEYLGKIDAVIAEAKNRGMDASELINFISARFSYSTAAKRVKVLFAMGMDQELLDANVKKLRDEILGTDVEGLLLDNALTRENAFKAFSWSDLVVVPEVAFDIVKEYLPKNKPVIRTSVNWKLFSRLKKGSEKKSKIGIIATTNSTSRTLANIFNASKLFKPKLMMTSDNVEEYKKELKDMDAIIVCLSARSVLEKTCMKNKNVYVFYDYIDEDSINEIKSFVKDHEIK